jgi:uncharacterized protein YdbL (DUF1318 family)
MTINDMNVLLAAIEVAVKRGAFSVLEIQQVGAVAEKLNSFLAQAKEQAEKQAAEAAANEAPPASTEAAA